MEYCFANETKGWPWNWCRQQKSCFFRPMATEISTGTILLQSHYHQKQIWKQLRRLELKASIPLHSSKLSERNLPKYFCFPHISHSLGDGCTIRFWYDKWAAPCPLAVLFLGSLISPPKKIISSPTFLVAEIGTSTFLENLNITKQMSSALFSLSSTPSSYYTTTRFYDLGFIFLHFLFFLKPTASIIFSHSSIWHPFVPSKVPGFFWKVAWGRVLTQDRFQILNPLIPLSPHICVFCHNHSESNDHLFIHCPFSCRLWGKLFCQINLSWVVSSTTFSFTQWRSITLRRKAKRIWNFFLHAVL